MCSTWTANAFLRPSRGRAVNGGRQAGFTLLETLVALVVFGFLVSGLTQGLRFGVAAWQIQTRTLAARGDMDAAERTLRALVARMDPGGMSGRPALLKGTPRSLAFTAELPQAAGALVTRDAELSVAVNDRHELQLLWLEHVRNRTRPAPPPGRATLLHDVERLDILYWGDDATGWQPEWAGSPLPKLVRIRVVFTHGSGRHGPDIVVMPMRDRWQQ